jgi:CRISPR type IV-associated DEAD/DEAH-box helicase Csf4
MATTKIRIPHDDRWWYGDGELSVRVKEVLTEALSTLDQTPAPAAFAPSLPSASVTIWVSREQKAQLDALCTSHDFAGEGQAAAALLHALAVAARPVSVLADPVDAGALTTLDRINQALGDASRPDQALFFRTLAKEVFAKRPAHEVVFAEAATGIGKSRAFLALVIDWCAANPGAHAIIASPSYNVILQTLAQWDRASAAVATPQKHVLLGQQEFVSEQALHRLLAEHPEVPAAAEASAWLAAKGPASDDDPFGHRWLMRSLRAATNFAWTMDDQVRLGSDAADDDAGLLAYRDQFTDARQAPVIFCTHAMLAVDVRRLTAQASKSFEETNDRSAADAAFAAWGKLNADDKRTSRTWEMRNDLLAEMLSGDAGRLPPIGLLIVDEAHQLEQAFASVFATAASMSSLRRALRTLHDRSPRAVRAGDMAEFDDIWNLLRDAGGHATSDTVDADSTPRLKEAVGKVRTLLGDILKRLPKSAMSRPEARQLHAVGLALDVAARATGERSGMRTRISWSPNVNWPSIQVGRYDVSRELDFLWALSVQNRSVLVSATLFEDVTIAGLEGMRRVLSVRSKLVRALDPVRPRWLYDPVTLHLVSDTRHADGLRRFRRPCQRDKLSPMEFAEWAERWRRDVSEYIARAYTKAAGGMLVLLTAHAERVELAGRLNELVPTDCLLGAGESLSLEAARRAFLERVADGKRPCLLGVGAAWTGLDISGDGLGHLTGRPVPAASDNVLTDLVIPTSPIGTNRSLTHEWRREHAGMIAEIGSTSIMFRQGIGRLVRREGLPNNRRLHFLDSRIHEMEWNSTLAPITRALTRYTHRINV